MKILCVTPWFPSTISDIKGNFVFDSVNALWEIGHQVVVLHTQPFAMLTARSIFKDKSLLNNNSYIQESQTRYRSNSGFLEYKSYCLTGSDYFNLYHQKHLSIPRNYLRKWSNLFYKLFVVPKIVELHKKYSFDLMHAHTELAGLAVAAAGKKLHVPTAMTIHGIDFSKKLYNKNRTTYKYDYALKNIDRIVMVGHTLIDYFKKFNPLQNNFSVVPNGFRLNKFNRFDNCGEKINLHKKLKFVSVSNLVKNKGVAINLNALAMLNTLGMKNWEYLIIGEGPEKNALMRLVDQFKLEKQVTFFNSHRHDDIYEQLSKSDVFILPSKPESFGIAYLEAMSCGLLAIGVADEGPAYFIQHNKTGLLIQNNDEQSLFETLVSIFKSPDHMQAIAKAGRAYVHQHVTWHHHAIKLSKVYRELIDNG